MTYNVFGVTLNLALSVYPRNLTPGVVMKPQPPGISFYKFLCKLNRRGMRHGQLHQ